jgi:hypothetical protein
MKELLWGQSTISRYGCSAEGPHSGTLPLPDCIVTNNTLSIYSLFETTQTLFWAVFGLIDLDNFELAGIKSFTRFWGMLMFGTYSVINIVVLLNLLIAMMNHSYQLISVSSVSLEQLTFLHRPGSLLLLVCFDVMQPPVTPVVCRFELLHFRKFLTYPPNHLRNLDSITAKYKPK